ncbi:MAG: TraB/GumN family protein [Rhizobiaceae bacterium]|jgi:hypothetical protein|nr:TraB/GumN family protein [Rhizobiaceae bacterium]
MLIANFLLPQTLDLIDRQAGRFADRIAAALCVISGLSVLVFFGLALAMMPARASDSVAAGPGPACAGSDLTTILTDPAVLAAIEARASATINGKGLLWKIEKDGLPASWLFGTMHVTDPRVVSLPPAADAAFNESTRLVIETTEVLDPVKAQAALMKRPDLMMFTDGTSLDTLIPAEDLAMVETALAGRGMPLASVRLMKPWMLAALFAMPACELNRKGGGADILDIDIARRAAAAGKPVEGLETIEEQISAMASLPIEDHVRGLVEAMRIGDRMEDVFETMISLYTRGEVARIMPVLNAALGAQGDAESAAAYAAFEEKMINARNRIMAERLPPHLAQGGAFVAIGALHLPGESGVIEELRRAGYTLTRVD